MKFTKKISIILFVTFFVQNVFASTFTVENDTGISPYRVELNKNGHFAEDFRLRVTFHETAKDLSWLNAHHKEVNKAYVPMLHGLISKSADIKFPEFESQRTKFITLYLTATYHNETKSDHFLNAVTFELNKPQSIKNVHIRFQSLETITDPSKIEITVKNPSKRSPKFTEKNYLSYMSVE